VTTSYLWCGSDICQARNAGNAAIRGYYDEGELVPGTPAQKLYYGIDQIGSVRRVFASPSSASAYGYDPYGLPLQGTAPLTDFVYGGMFYNADSGLYLTRYRAYDPTAGRWLSRDPVGEPSDPAANLYAYVAGNPISFVDPDGDNPILIGVGIGIVAGGGADLVSQLINNGGRFDCIEWASVGSSAAIGAAAGGGAGFIAGIFERTFAYLAARAAAQSGLITADTSMLARASQAALNAAQRANQFVLGAKHTAGSGGRWAKFVGGVNPNTALREALRSPAGKILPNDGSSFKVVTDLGRVVGSRGETGVRVIVDFEGRVVTWFPVKP